VEQQAPTSPNHTVTAKTMGRPRDAAHLREHVVLEFRFLLMGLKAIQISAT